MGGMGGMGVTPHMALVKRVKSGTILPFIITQEEWKKQHGI